MVTAQSHNIIELYQVAAVTIHNIIELYQVAAVTAHENVGYNLLLQFNSHEVMIIEWTGYQYSQIP